MALLKHSLRICLTRRRRHPAAWLSRPAPSRRAPLPVWARSRHALADRGVAPIRRGEGRGFTLPDRSRAATRSGRVNP